MHLFLQPYCTEQWWLERAGHKKIQTQQLGSLDRCHCPRGAGDFLGEQTDRVEMVKHCMFDLETQVWTHRIQGYMGLITRGVYQALLGSVNLAQWVLWEICKCCLEMELPVDLGGWYLLSLFYILLRSMAVLNMYCFILAFDSTAIRK